MAWACLLDGAGARRNAQGEDLRFFCGITTTIFLNTEGKSVECGVEWRRRWDNENTKRKRNVNCG